VSTIDDNSRPVEYGSGMIVSGASIEERVISAYEKHREAIYRFLVAQGLPPAVAQEITQDVFVTLFTALTKGDTVQSEQAWLYTVAARAAVNHWRREGRPMWVELDGNAGLAGSQRSGDLTPEASAEHQQKMERVAAGLTRLPKEQRLCIYLRMQGLRYREIAGILSVSTSTAAEWLATAIDRLKGDAHA
jgi:RNA polymerase sigma-70 factor (ECF subfamily)